MARSWASVACSALPVAPKPAEAPAWTPPPQCYYCSSAADVCPKCVQICSYSPGWGLQPVVADGRCSEHARYHESRNHAFYSVDMAKYIPQTCASCRTEHPWRAADCLQITGFSYERACLCHPLKSPNGGRFNVVFVPIYHRTRVGEVKRGKEQVAVWAQAAYDKEMEFSGEVKRAEVMKEAVLSDDPFADIRNRLYEAGAD